MTRALAQTERAKSKVDGTIVVEVRIHVTSYRYSSNEIATTVCLSGSFVVFRSGRKLTRFGSPASTRRAERSLAPVPIEERHGT
jgi:hypothetical protein